jgi:hypothetical protein
MGKARGIAKAKHIHAQRSEHSKKSDESKTAHKIYRPTKKDISKWRKHPDRSDIRHVDTKK